MNVDVAVVGGGAAGVDAAVAVREQQPGSSVALISPDQSLRYRPWLVYLPAGAASAADMTMPLSDIADQHGFELVHGQVTQVDPEASQITIGPESAIVEYKQLILAPGAPADRARIAGAEKHAIFPCDADGAQELIDRLAELSEATVLFVLTGERIGPGLEYAGWVARAARAKGREGIRVTVVEDGDALDRQFGVRAADRILQQAATLGIESIRHARIEQVADGELLLAERRVRADLICVTSPLRGPDLGLPGHLLNSRGMLTVDPTLAAPTARNVFAAGDFSDVQGMDAELPKTWIMARLQAETAARNAVAALRGEPAAELDRRKVTRMSAISMPDVGGQTVFVRNRKPVVGGSWPLRLRYRMDAKYLARYRTSPGATRPSM
ncbi:FAD-dependent oxidoreductase [Streptomyces sp. LHD-70]|uniref:NAD(P)/FAD-dependent oxidoreductase n=1 Tax=Streptomyces sp. LHD-70 TaxID=3072140 RepID=UPI00280FE73D|nr:FAD-dependent oxidoreductase [Streptomyces sp. LHD-70]MDQ8706517.1 FAD-dependent oxidoreductase [Streptomyces sp. LHD-70]